MSSPAGRSSWCGSRSAVRCRNRLSKRLVTVSPCRTACNGLYSFGTFHNMIYEVIRQVNFSHYTDDTVLMATDLINTFEASEGVDRLATPEDLAGFIEAHAEVLMGRKTAPVPTQADVAEVQALRARLRKVFEAPDDQTAARLINDVLSNVGARPQVSVHGSQRPHLHYEPAGDRVVDWLGSAAAMALATVLVEEGTKRFGVCRSHDCDDAFVDASKNRSKNYCSTTCTTRENVAAHRARTKNKVD